MKHYNLALIFVSFQRCCIYLSLIKELSGKYKIALCPQSADSKTFVRTKNTINDFLELCQSYGAELIYNEKISADLEILPQTNYTKETIERIDSNIKSTKTFWLSGLAMGNAQYEFLHGKKIDKILVVDRNLYRYRINEYEGPENQKFDEKDIIEIGVPYKKYPIFPSYGIDYLLANPTPFSFCCVSDRLEYLENVYSLILQTDEADIIALKPHNADERVDYIVSEKIFLALKGKLLAPFHSLIDSSARKLVKLFRSGFFHEFWVNVSIAILYAKLMKRVVRFSEITSFYNLNLELFLPNVKKGMITGRSNSIWHGLYNRLPVYNCIDENKEYFSDTKMHQYCMKYLNVHGNYYQLEFDDMLFKKVDHITIEADAVKIVAEHLDQIRLP